jgi:hypothetical protein
MTHIEIVNRLIGDISPAGDASVDGQRFENLAAYCELYEAMHDTLRELVARNAHTHEHSVRKAVQYAEISIASTKY